MEKSLIFYLSFIVILFLTTCESNPSFYKKEISKESHDELADKLLSGLGYRYYYQGSVGEQALLEEAALYNPDHPEVWRERGIPYLKRGMAAKFYGPYDKCVQADAIEWQGYRGYCYLYFYRDYERALADFNALDTLTPNFVDHPQAQSVDFMRAICYLGMKDAKKSLAFIDKHIASETEKVGEDYIDAISFLTKGRAHELLNELDAAQATYELGIKVHNKNADLEYHLAKVLYKKGQKEKALALIEKAKTSFQEGYGNSRPYVEEFWQVYYADITDLESIISKGKKT